MPRYQTIQNSFSNGEISPKIFPRVDTSEYSNGLKELSNFLIGPTGGAFRRTGFTGGSPESDQSITYAYGSSLNGFDISFGFGAAGISGITSISSQANSNYLAAYAELKSGFVVTKAGSFYIMTHSSGNYFPWVFYVTDISLLQIRCVVYDELFVELVSSGINNTAGNTLDFFSIPFNDFSNSTISITPSAVTGSITLTASAALFKTTDTDGYFLLENDNHDVITQRALLVKVTGYTSATVISADVVSAIGTPTAAACFTWTRSAWSTTLGFPKTVAFIDNRLLFANTESQPNTIWGSEQYFSFWFNKYFEFLRNTSAGQESYYYGSFGYIIINSASVSYPANGTFSYNISSKQGGDIRWLEDFNGLLIGTDTSVKRATSSNGEGSPSRTSIFVDTVASIRCSNIQPTVSPSAIFLVDDTKENIWKLEASEESRGFAVSNISALNPNIKDDLPLRPNNQISRLQWHQSSNTLWCVMSGGKLVSYTYSRSPEIGAWASHTFPGIVYDVSIRPVTDQVFFMGMTSSTYGSQYIRAFMLPRSLEGEDLYPIYESAIYLDLYGTAITDGSGNFSYNTSIYSNTTLTVIDEDGDITELAVDGSGTASMGAPKANKQLAYGYVYTSQLATLTPNIGANQLLNSQGDILRIDRVTAYLYKTWGGQYSGNGVNFYDMEIPVEPNTRKYQFDLNSSPDIESSVTIRSSGALPLNVTGLVMRGNNNP